MNTLKMTNEKCFVTSFLNKKYIHITWSNFFCYALPLISVSCSSPRENHLINYFGIWGIPPKKISPRDDSSSSINFLVRWHPQRATASFQIQQYWTNEYLIFAQKALSDVHIFIWEVTLSKFRQEFIDYKISIIFLFAYSALSKKICITCFKAHSNLSYFPCLDYISGKIKKLNKVFLFIQSKFNLKHLWTFSDIKLS